MKLPMEHEGFILDTNALDNGIFGGDCSELARAILQPGRRRAFDLLEMAPASMYCGPGSFFGSDRSGGDDLHVLIIEHEVCKYCWHDAPVDGRCDNCGARPGDRRC